VRQEARLDASAPDDRGTAHHGGVGDHVREVLDLDDAGLPLLSGCADEGVEPWERLGEDELTTDGHLDAPVITDAHLSRARPEELDAAPVRFDQSFKQPSDRVSHLPEREAELIAQALHRPDLDELFERQQGWSAPSLRTHGVSEETGMQPVVHLAWGHAGLEDAADLMDRIHGPDRPGVGVTHQGEG
jgi:hypothetical protein